MTAGRARLLVLSVAVGGCAGADLCNYAELKADTCITVHVSGALILGQMNFDNVFVDVTYTLGGEPHARRLNPMRISDGGILNTLPIALGVVYPKLAQASDSSSVIKVLLTRDNRPVAFGLHSFSRESGSIKSGTHGSIPIEVKPATAANSDCFNAIKNLGESDVDCGGSLCPLCGPGKQCFRSSGATSDCASGVCVGTAAAEDRCQ